MVTKWQLINYDNYNWMSKRSDQYPLLSDNEKKFRLCGCVTKFCTQVH